MKRLFLILLVFVFSLCAKADHITGGEMFYKYLGLSSGQHTYSVTLKLFMRCNSGRSFPSPAIISVFNRSELLSLVNGSLQDIEVNITTQETIQLTDFGPCISDPPEVCYEVAYYNVIISLPATIDGYVLASQVNYRIRGISNLVNTAQIGATYTCEIPGTEFSPGDMQNSSAAFTGSDLVVVCAGNFFTYSFAASDADGDQIHYSFCNAFMSSTSGANTAPTPPPYNSVPYNYPDFTENTPLGSDVMINPSTGLITGKAPPEGIYVVTVCAEEIRNGVVIATQRKDLQIKVADCSIAAALLENDYMLCNTSRSITISNKSNSSLIVSYDWQIFNPSGTSIYSTNNTYLDYTFPVNGVYTVQLIINKGQQCSDTASAPVYVFPGLNPGFNVSGICINRPTVFTDQTTLISGSINSWNWDFGEPATVVDVSNIQNPEYQYPLTGTKIIRLIVTTTDGCRDTASKSITAINKSPITLAFRDTLICKNDIIQLQASGQGSFTWSPATNLINPNSPSPLVSPVTTTTYYATLETDGCINSDSVNVNVVDHVSLQVMNDTTICTNDTLQLKIISDGLQYAWTPSSQFINPNVKEPFAITPSYTTYRVTAVIGGCFVTTSINVTPVPYPTAFAGLDTIICTNTTAQLHAVTDGSSWQWSPVLELTNPTALNPVASPAATTIYIFNAYDTRGCPKPSRDSIMVTVLPPIHAFAGRDTTIVIGQPLQLNASGGEAYLWSPPSSLSVANIPNPVALFDEASGGLQYKVQVFNAAGCYETASLNIKVFATLPAIFVPTAFTPNDDGKNDILVPITAGMKRLENFSIFNRWGQLVFSTATEGQGWDGRINGQLQSNNTYVWIVKAIDYTGNPYFQKGTVTLIR